MSDPLVLLMRAVIRSVAAELHYKARVCVWQACLVTSAGASGVAMPGLSWHQVHQRR